MSDAYRLRWDDADWRSGLTLVRERDGAEIAYDYGEPEDRTFGRDFAPVVQEMNGLARVLAASESERRALRSALADLYFGIEDKGLADCTRETGRDGGKPGAPVHSTFAGTFRPEECPVCLARRVYDEEEARAALSQGTGEGTT